MRKRVETKENLWERVKSVVNSGQQLKTVGDDWERMKMRKLVKSFCTCVDFKVLSHSSSFMSRLVWLANYVLLWFAFYLKVFFVLNN